MLVSPCNHKYLGNGFHVPDSSIQNFCVVSVKYCDALTNCVVYYGDVIISCVVDGQVIFTGRCYVIIVGTSGVLDEVCLCHLQGIRSIYLFFEN